MKVINLFGGPGCGKSTTATGIFYLLKSRHHINCEYVSEYAKLLAWENDQHKICDQLYVTAKQNRGLERLRGKVDYAVTDSPLLLGIHYATKYRIKSLRPLTVELFNSYDNVNFYIRRKKKYNTSGRFHSESQAVEIDEAILTLLKELNISYTEIDGNESAADDIVARLIQSK